MVQSVIPRNSKFPSTHQLHNPITSPEFQTLGQKVCITLFVGWFLVPQKVIPTVLHEVYLYTWWDIQMSFNKTSHKSCTLDRTTSSQAPVSRSMDHTYYVAQSEVHWSQVDSLSSLLAPSEISSSNFVVVMLAAQLVLLDGPVSSECVGRWQTLGCVCLGIVFSRVFSWFSGTIFTKMLCASLFICLWF